MTVGNASSTVPTATWSIAARAILERPFGHCNRANAPRGPHAIADAPAAAVRDRVAPFGPSAANAHNALVRFFAPTATPRKPVVTRDVWTANARNAASQRFRPTANTPKAVVLFFGSTASRQHRGINHDARFSLLFLDAFQ